MTREELGRVVRGVWVTWAREQADARHSWLVPWDDLDDGQREVDMRIGEAVAAVERERIMAGLPERITGALTRIELRIAQHGPMARKVVADHFADAIVRCLAEGGKNGE